MNDSSTRPLTMWVIFDHPRDHPGHFVLRRQYILPGRVTMGPATLHATLDEARGTLPPFLARMPHQEDDDPCIVEVWL